MDVGCRGIDAVIQAKCVIDTDVHLRRSDVSSCLPELFFGCGLLIAFSASYLPPHTVPWQRAIDENSNDLPRQYKPKWTDLPVFSQDELDAIAFQLNTQPWRDHSGYRTTACSGLAAWLESDTVAYQFGLWGNIGPPSSAASSTESAYPSILERFCDGF